jgi:hypothetical protein
MAREGEEGMGHHVEGHVEGIYGRERGKRRGKTANWPKNVAFGQILAKKKRNFDLGIRARLRVPTQIRTAGFFLDG